VVNTLGAPIDILAFDCGHGCAQEQLCREETTTSYSIDKVLELQKASTAGATPVLYPLPLDKRDDGAGWFYPADRQRTGEFTTSRFRQRRSVVSDGRVHRGVRTNSHTDSGPPHTET